MDPCPAVNKQSCKHHSIEMDVMLFSVIAERAFRVVQRISSLKLFCESQGTCHRVCRVTRSSISSLVLGAGAKGAERCVEESLLSA